MPPRPRRTQDERSEETRQALYRATIRLLLERGYSRFTTGDAAAMAGVSRGALTHHFTTKEDLVVRSVAHDLGVVTEGLRRFLADGAGQRRGPDEIVDHLWGLMAGHLFYVTMEYLPEARHNAPFRERLLPVVRDFHAALDALWLSVSDAHGLDPAEARVTLNATLCLMRGMVAQSVLKPDESYFAGMLAHWKAHLRTLFAAFAPRDPAVSGRPPAPGALRLLTSDLAMTDLPRTDLPRTDLPRTDLSARIERLPFGRFHGHLLLMGGLGYSFDGLDLAIVSFVLPVLRPLWSLSSVEIGVLGSGTYVGYLFGALFAGLLGDRIGRRAVMMYALVLYCAASLVSAFAQDWTFFLGCRIVAGIGTGAESAIVAPFLAEFVAARIRGRFTGSLAGFFSFGFFAAALLGYFAVPAAPGAWRWVMILTATPVLMLLWWRRTLPESPRWLASVGRSAEAEAVVARMEESARRAGHVLPQPAVAPAAAPSPLPRRGSMLGQIAALWRPGLARITAMSWIMWLSITFSYYAFFTWIPSLLVESGMTITKSFGYSIAIFAAQIPGYFSAAYLNERIGRQATIASYMVLGGLSAVALAVSHADATVTAAGVCLSFFMNGTYAGIYAYTPEIFPTAVRATGMGTASAVGRLGAIASPLLVGWLYPHFGFAGVFGTTTVVLLVGALSVMVMGISTRNRPLEEISADELAPAAAAR